MTTICSFSDTHGFHEKLTLPPVDISIFAGDMCAWSRDEDCCKFLLWYKDQPPRHKIYIPGNHDRPFENKRFRDRMIDAWDPLLIYLEDSFVIIDGIKIWGSPYQVEFFNWAFNLPRGGWELEKKWRDIPDDTNIVVTHAPPKGILDMNLQSNHTGDELLLDRIKVVKPKYHIFGHIHEAAGIVEIDDTYFINSAICDRSYKPVRVPFVFEY
jgi:Icc-related predicted phosphoesterase